MLSCCHQKCCDTSQITSCGCGAIVSSQSRCHRLQDGEQQCLWLCEAVDGEGIGCLMDGQTDGWTAWQTPGYCYPASSPLRQEPLSAAARQEGACHKRTVWLKHSGVLWINWILLTALLTCCILTGLGGDYRALEQISIHRSTQILGFNKNILWLRHTADQIQPRLTPGAISLISVG